MQFQMFTPLAEGVNGVCFVSGSQKRGYLTVKVDGVPTEVGPDANPDSDPLKRDFQAQLFGVAVTFFTKPGWKQGSQVEVKCFEADGTPVDEKSSPVV